MPLPVLPTMAVVSPGRGRERDAAQDRLLGARVAELDVAELDARRSRGGLIGSAGSWMDGSVARTSLIRPLETAARGTITNMNVAIRTAKRIWMRYWRNAVRLPIGISPLSTRKAPNQRTATVDRFMIAIRVGIMIAKSRLTGSAVANRSVLAASKRRSSWSVRTNARMTRTPASVSRMTWLIRSILTCMAWKSGRARRTRRPMMTTMIGTITRRSPDRGTSWRRAMISPPTIMIGAETIIVRPMRTTIWTCCTSFVLRVISEAVPKWLTSTWRERLDLAEDRARARRARTPIATFADQ